MFRLSQKTSLVPKRKQKFPAFAWIIALVIAIGAIVVGAFIKGKSYVVVSIVVIFCAIIPFFIQFERRRPQAREIVTMAVMCAIAVTARAAFIWVPHFKPMAAIIMISGMGFGASSGFLIGSLSILVSDLIFGVGPWVPWQMLSFGICGFLFGLFTDTGLFPRENLTWPKRIVLSLIGFITIVFISGPILDTSSLFYMFSNMSPGSVIAVYAAGFPINCIHGAATFVTLLLLANPMLGKFARLRNKYGMYE